MGRSSPRTWTGDSDLPYPDGQDWVHQFLDGPDLVRPFQGVPDSGLPFLDDLDLVHPCLDVRDLVPLDPCLDSVLPCPDVMMVPWGCFPGAKKGPLEHFHQEVYQGLIHEDCQIQGHLV